MIKTLEYKTNGVCANLITISYDSDTIVDVVFNGGCRGNTSGLSSLLRGMKIDEAISRLEGVNCRNGTSCPDQLSQALKRCN